MAISASVPLLAQTPVRTLPARITSAVDDSHRVTLQGNVHPLAQSRYDRGPAPVSMPTNRMILVLKRSAQQEADLQTYLEAVQDPNSSDYHKYLSPAAFGQRFGVGDADLQTIETWLTGHGLKVNKVSKGKMALELSGTVGQVEDAFRTSVHSYAIGGKQFWANATDPQIPAALAPVVAGMASLSSFKPEPQYIRGPSGVYDPVTHAITPTYTIGNTTSGYYIFLGPADAATIYDTATVLNPNHPGTTYDGTGVTIGIAGDSNIDLTQNANYRATFGLAPKATTVVVDGADPGENGDAIESYLDTQVAGGIAPNANVILYTAANTDFQSGLFLAILRAIDDNQADILNVSFGACEAAIGTAGNQYISALWEQAAAQGISVTVSSGDSGSAGCDDPNSETVSTGGLAVNGISSTPFNISVGGTDYDALVGANYPTGFTNYVDITNTLPNHRSALKYIPEEPWNDGTYPNSSILQNIPISVASHYQSADNIVAAGGGVSAVYSAPTWQTGLGSAAGRNLPDVSFLAGNGFYGALWGLCTDFDTDAQGNPVADCAAGATGNSFYLTGVGGTSAAAPAFAGMLALVEQKTGSRLGQADYVLYDLAKSRYGTVFHDVTTGDNSVECQSGTMGCQAVDSVNTYYLSGYNAGTGYDQASGLGSVDATQMLNNWASAGLVSTTSALTLNGATTALNITHGQSVTVSDAVTGSGGTPTGDIALVDNLSAATQPNNEGIADFALSGGAASGTTIYLPGGTYQVSAHYGGSSTFAESDSNAIPVTVGAEDSTTNLKVAGYYDPATGSAATTPYYGFIYLIDAQPYGNSASLANPDGAASGIVTFKNGTATLGTAVLSSEGIAELQTALLPGGSDSLTAVFPGDESFKASTSAAVAFSVTPAVTNLMTPTAQPDIFQVGGKVTLSVTLAADSAGAAPTGTVTFMNGTTTLGSVNLVGTGATSTALAGGTASFSTTSLPSGLDSITADYSGDSNYGGATSLPVSILVTTVQTTVTFAPASPTIKVNQALQFTVTPTPARGLPLPTGSVTLYQGNYLVPAVTLINGVASVTIPANAFQLGSSSIQVVYSGDSDYSPDYVNLPITVLSAGTIAPKVTVAPPTSIVNFPFSINVTVSGPSGDPVPTGTVTLSSPGGFISPSPVPLTNGSATVTISCCMAGGPNALTVTYLGDSNYTAGTGSGSVDLFSTSYVTISNVDSAIEVDQPFSVTVAVTSAYTNLTNPPTGTITLSSGTYTSAPSPLTAGSASITIPANSLAVGTDVLTATYSGDTNYLPGSNSEGVSIAAAPPFKVSGTNVSVSPGATTGNTSTITVTPIGGFTGSVAVTATITASPPGAQFPPTMSLSAPGTVSITGASAGTATLTFYTTSGTLSCSAANRLPRGVPWYAGGGTVLACMLWFGIPARRRRWRAMLGLVLLLAGLAGGVASCGGGGNTACTNVMTGGTTAGTYTVTLAGTSGGARATGTITLTLQ